MKYIKSHSNKISIALVLVASLVANIALVQASSIYKKEAADNFSMLQTSNKIGLKLVAQKVELVGMLKTKNQQTNVLAVLTEKSSVSDK